MLLKDGGKVAFRHIVLESAVAEDELRLHGRRQFREPGGDAQGVWFNLRAGGLRGQAHQQHARADAMDGLACNDPLLDWYGENEPELQHQFKENVRLAAPSLDMLGVILQRPGQVVAVRFPGADLAGIEFEDTVAKVAGKEWIFVFNLFPGTAKALNPSL
jgi:hypothetical protein